MALEDAMGSRLEHLRFLDEDTGAVIAELRAELRLYLDVPLNQLVTEILETHDGLLAWLGRERLNWWRNQSMPRRAPVRRCTHTALRVALTRAVPKDIGTIHFIAVDPKLAGEGALVLPNAGLSLLWHDERGNDAGLPTELRAFDSTECLLEEPTRWLDCVLAICDYLPIKSGTTGFVIEDMHLTMAERGEVYGRAMRHPGVDMDNWWSSALAGPGTIRGVSWLTVLGSDAVSALGGRSAVRAALDPAVGVHETKHAIVLQAGPRPELGDVNRGELLPLHRNVYRLVEPLHQPMIGAAQPFVMGREDDDERTEAWLRRFGDYHP